MWSPRALLRLVSNRSCPHSTFGDTLHQLTDTGDGAMQVVKHTVGPGLLLVAPQRLDVLRTFNLIALVEAARMRGDEFSAVEDAHRAQIGDHREDPVDASVRYRVVIQIESGVRHLPDADLDTLVRLEWHFRQWQ